MNKPATVDEVASFPGADVLRGLDADEDGLSQAPAQADVRRARYGPNAVTSHRARLLPVLWYQIRSPLLVLLLIAAVVSYFVGERSDAVIIGVIVAASAGLEFFNEYRAEKAAEALQSQIRHQSLVLRDGRSVQVEVTRLVPGDVVDLRLGDIVPADVRLLSVAGLECDGSVLTRRPRCRGQSSSRTSSIRRRTPAVSVSGYPRRMINWGRSPAHR